MVILQEYFVGGVVGLVITTGGGYVVKITGPLRRSLFGLQGGQRNSFS